MGKVRTALIKLADFTTANMAIVLFILAVLVVIDLAGRMFPQVNLGDWFSILDAASIFLAIGSFGASVYRKRVQNRQEREEEQKLHSEIRLRLERILESSIGYLNLGDEKARESIAEDVSSSFAARYRLYKLIDTEAELEIAQALLSCISKHTAIEEGKQLLLAYLYLTKYSTENVQLFLDRLNKRKMQQEGTAESNFLRLLRAYDKTTAATFEELESQAKEISKEELKVTMVDVTGQGPIYEKIAETANDERRYDNLKRIVSVVINQGYVSTRGLLPFLQTEGDILCVIKSEAGLSSSLSSLFMSRKEMTPFKKVLLDYGFVQPSRYEYFTFVLPLSRVPQQYRQSVHLFMEKEIIPKVRREWERLYQTYGYKRLQSPTYGYLAFIVKRPDMSWARINMQFRQQFEDQILGRLTPSQTARLIVTQIHSIPKILRQMEVDSLVTVATNSQKLALRESEPEMRKEIENQLGISIKDITGYSKLEGHRDDFTNILGTWISRNLNPKARKKCDPETAKKITEEILSNAIDIKNLIESLGVKV